MKAIHLPTEDKFPYIDDRYDEISQNHIEKLLNDIKSYPPIMEVRNTHDANYNKDLKWTLEADLCYANTTCRHSYDSKIIQPRFNHLYILSDEDIKEGDWVYNSETNHLFKAKNVSKYPITSHYANKVIATTDKSLGLAIIDEAFVKLYCEKNGEVEIESVRINLTGLRKATERAIITPKENEMSKEEFMNKICREFYYDDTMRENAWTNYLKGIKVKFKADFIDGTTTPKDDKVEDDKLLKAFVERFIKAYYPQGDYHYVRQTKSGNFVIGYTNDKPKQHGKGAEFGLNKRFVETMMEMAGFTKEDMIKFGTWCRNKGNMYHPPEIFEQWLKERSK